MDNIYQDMWASTFPKIKTGHISLDTQMDNPMDNRRGITLLIRLDKAILSNMIPFLKQLKIIAPKQYYYPLTDLHLTTLSIISCRANFQLTQINLKLYQQLIKNTLQNLPSFQLDFSGITLATSGIVAKGYDTGGALNKMRDALRMAFKETNLANTIDQRYVLKAAHCTLLRFKNPLQQTNAFLDFLKQHRDTSYGMMKVSAVDLVFNDWYMKAENVQLLDRYNLME